MSDSEADNLILFARIAQHGGFSAAGRALDIPKSRLSRRLSRLEEQLGARLIQRNSRGFSLTAIGEQVRVKAEAILSEIEATKTMVEGHRAQPQGALRVSCPITISQYWFSPLLPAFLARYPRVQVVLVTTNRRVDLIAERIDVALRVRHGQIEEPDCVIRKLLDAPDILVAAPELADGLGDLAPDNLPVLADGQTLATASDEPHVWRLVDASGHVHHFSHRPRLITNDMGALRRAALDGAGVALIPLMACVDDLATGRLVRLLPEWSAGSGVLQVAYASRRGMAPPVRALVDFLVDAAAARPVAPASAAHSVID
jgi:DNA-binding transcriptional LysR family regulator